MTISGATHFNNLSRILAGTVDSPVNGGVGQYRVFLTGATYDDPEYEADVGYLKNCFNNLIKLLNNLLKLHQALVPANLKPQHELMMELFDKNFKAEIDDLKLDTKSVLKLDDMVEAMIASNIRTRRQQKTFLGSQYGSSADVQSSSGYSHPDSSTGNFLVTPEDNDSILGGSNNSGSVHNSIHSAGSGSKMSSAISSFSGRPGSTAGGSTAGWSATGSQYGGKRTVLNYK
ncbi:unnamed protein product [Ambrosiozyma monospora]|uniref:Unnamed protein product n=1 Tax=Ambrosiozyma monospora TaxID=43982 RepID=A0A9W6T044_AMBMO|nr:unnamed protein product [Ambrosiozyma monospora]